MGSLKELENGSIRENNVSLRKITLEVYSRYEKRKIFAMVIIVDGSHIAIGEKVELTILQSHS